MCGIIGILGRSEVTPRLIEALKRLEYRGYDSAGVATVHEGRLDRRRAKGKISELQMLLHAEPLAGEAGIGHTRWATHGAATTENAHPHVSTGVAVVHNGIIENFNDIRSTLQKDGVNFVTETDTETMVHLIGQYIKTGISPQEAVRKTLPKLKGAFAIAALFEGNDDLMIGARRGSPLVVGVGDGEMYLGSDALAVAPFTDRVVYLEEGDWCVVTRTNYEVFDEENNPVRRPVTVVSDGEAAVEKGNYAHFMQKEIFEQPESTARTINNYTNSLTGEITLPPALFEHVDLDKLAGVHLVACGTAYYACQVAEYWFEQIANVRVKTDIASEFRYRKPVLLPNELAIFVSQSGETADTLAALRYCKAAGLKTAAVVNVQTSTIAREADIVLPTLAGPEIGVASTKAFTAQLCALAATVIAVGSARGQLEKSHETVLTKALFEVPALIGDAVGADKQITSLAKVYAGARDMIFLGRGVHFPIAMEGALKLKEISYIHAAGFASGELKHGPIALISADTPVVMIAPNDELFEKSLSNLQEVEARHGPVLLVSDSDGVRKAGDAPTNTLAVPDCHPFIAPIIYTIPMQLLAYHVACARGTDVDQPRNLAKSVTVE